MALITMLHRINNTSIHEDTVELEPDSFPKQSSLTPYYVR